MSNSKYQKKILPYVFAILAFIPIIHMILTVNKSQYLVMYLNHKDFLRTKIMINLKMF